jgi:hypothetical protein
MLAIANRKAEILGNSGVFYPAFGEAAIGKANSAMGDGVVGFNNPFLGQAIGGFLARGIVEKLLAFQLLLP